jgi:hypothetical protein
MRRTELMTALMAAILAVTLATACAPAKQKSLAAAEPASTEKRLAMATSYLVNLAVVGSDTASVQAGYATLDAPIDRLHQYVTSARAAVQRVNQSIDDAITTGERLRSYVEPKAMSAGQTRRYSHYWYLGRAKLDVAKIEAERAVSAADSVLACAAPSCVTAPARSLQTHSLAAAGAAREAESLVRIAMIYVK